MFGVLPNGKNDAYDTYESAGTLPPAFTTGEAARITQSSHQCIIRLVNQQLALDPRRRIKGVYVIPGSSDRRITAPALHALTKHEGPNGQIVIPDYRPIIIVTARRAELRDAVEALMADCLDAARVHVTDCDFTAAMLRQDEVVADFYLDGQSLKQERFDRLAEKARENDAAHVFAVKPPKDVLKQLRTHLLLRDDVDGPDIGSV